MRLLLVGTYDARAHPRVRVLAEGLAAAGHEVVEVNEPLGLDTAWRVRLLRQPWLAPVLLGRVVVAWLRLATRLRRVGPVDAVLVGYLGHLDVHLARAWARRRSPGAPVVLDHLVWLADTAADRGAEAGALTRLLARVDDAALRAADVVVLDTDEHRALLPAEAVGKAVVVPVGAPSAWFTPPEPRPPDAPLRVVFFGLFTPLQGAPVIAAALRRLADRGVSVDATMVGRGQDLEAAMAAAGQAPVRWLPWVEAEALPSLVASCDVCLGVFGTGPKALRVVPNKVYQGAAAGCAVVTSDTSPQRAALGPEGQAAWYVPPGDPEALATVLAALARDRPAVELARHAAHARALARFRPEAVVQPLQDRLAAGGGA